MVAVLDGAGGLLLELPLAGLGELGETRFRQFLDEIESVISGDLSPEELATLASRYDEADLRGPTGELPDAALIEGDHAAAQAVRDAQAAALAHPQRRAEIARDLLQVLIEQDGDLDLEQLALETALEFLPGKGIYDLGVDAVEMVRAIGEGDWAAVATIGGVALLDAIGSVPGIGPLAKRGLERIAKGLRLIKTAGQEAAERIAKLARGGSKEAKALENATQDSDALAKSGKPGGPEPDEEDLARRADEQFARAARPNKEGLDVSEFVDKDQWAKLDQHERKWVRIDTHRLLGKEGEAIVLPAARSKLLRDGYDPLPDKLTATYRGIEFIPDLIGIRKGAQPVASADVTDKSVIRFKTSDGLVIYRLEDVRLVDAKLGKGGLTRNQKAVQPKLLEAGHEGIVKASPRFADLDLEAAVRALTASKSFQHFGIVAKVEDLQAYAKKLGLKPESTLNSHWAAALFAGFTIERLLEASGQDETAG